MLASFIVYEEPSILLTLVSFSEFFREGNEKKFLNILSDSGMLIEIYLINNYQNVIILLINVINFIVSTMIRIRAIVQLVEKMCNYSLNKIKDSSHIY